MCPICLEEVPLGPTRAALNCGGGHVMHVACLQDFVNAIQPLETGDQGPRGSLINYIMLPICPECRRRFAVSPHMIDPMGFDGLANNYPLLNDAPRHYYDATQGLTVAEVQLYVLDAAANALAAVAAQQQAQQQAQPQPVPADGGDDDYEAYFAQVAAADPGEAVAADDQDDHFDCTQCNQAVNLAYGTGAEYREARPPGHNDVPCPVCNDQVTNDDVNVRACNGCWRAWHSLCTV